VRKPVDIIDALDKYSHGLASDEDLERIVIYCHRIAASRLRLLYFNSSRRGKVTFEEINDAAYSCIATLFCTPRDGGLPLIAKSWTSIREKAGVCGKDALNHFDNVVRIAVVQQHNEILRELYPSEWRIRKSIRNKTNRSSRWKTIRSSEELLVVITDEPFDGYRPIPHNLLRSMCFAHFRGDDSVPAMVEKALEGLENYESFNCLRLNDLARTIIDYLMSVSFTDNIMPSRLSEVDGEIMLNALCGPVLEKCRRAIQQIYVRKRKVSGETGRAYQEALSAYLNDWLACGRVDTLYSYLSDAMPDLTKEEYRRTHKSRIHYLIDIMRRELQKAADKSSKAGFGS